MATNEAARQEHELLYPSQPSALADTDPEFAELFDNFAFGEILDNSELARPDRLLYQLAALIAVGAVSEFRTVLGSALDIGVSPLQVKEVLYQAVAYVGVGRVVEPLAATNQILTARGVPLPLEGQSTTTPDTRMEMGLAKQKEIVGSDNVDSMYQNAPADTLRFQRFLSGNCFGDFYTRGTLDVKQRELVTFSLLVALGGADSQAKSHVGMNLTVGNTRAQLLDVLTVLLPFIGYPRTLNGLAAINAATS